VVQRSEHAHRALELARAEAEGFGHRYLGPEHLVLGVQRHGDNGASEVLVSLGVDLVAARTALRHLAARGVVPGPRPSDTELLESLGIDLDAVRRDTEQTFGFQAVGEATWRVTRRRPWWGRRVVWTPLCGPRHHGDIVNRPSGKTPATVTPAPEATRPAGLAVTDLEEDVGQLEARFNADQGAPRLVLALAPT
jgi:hypothetical protein